MLVLPLRVCPRTPSSRNFQVYAARDVRRSTPASCSETPHPTGWLARGHSRSGSSSRVRLAGQDARSWTLHRGFRSRTRRQNPKSRVRSRRATQTGRNDWAAPEPVTGIFLTGQARLGVAVSSAGLSRAVSPARDSIPTGHSPSFVREAPTRGGVEMQALHHNKSRNLRVMKSAGRRDASRGPAFRSARLSCRWAGSRSSTTRSSCPRLPP